MSSDTSTPTRFPGFRLRICAGGADGPELDSERALREARELHASLTAQPEASRNAFFSTPGNIERSRHLWFDLIRDREFGAAIEVFLLIPPPLVGIFIEAPMAVRFLQVVAKKNLDESTYEKRGGKERYALELSLLLLRSVPGIRESGDGISGGEGQTLLHSACDGKLGKFPIESAFLDELLSVRIPDERVRDSKDDGNSPLHLAVLRRPPVLIERVIEAYPEMPSVQNDHGNTPLHILSLQDDETPSYRCGDTSNSELTAAGEFRHGYNRETAVVADRETVMRMLIDDYPEALQVENIDGDTPLLGMIRCRYNAPLSELKILLDSCPDQVIRKFFYRPTGDDYDPYWEQDAETNGDFPEWRSPFGQLLRNLKHECVEYGDVTNFATPPAPLRQMDNFGNFWSRLVLMLLAATTKTTAMPLLLTPGQHKWRAVDAIVSCSPHCPFEVFILAAWEHFGHPEKQDEEGMLPLHLVARSAMMWWELEGCRNYHGGDAGGQDENEEGNEQGQNEEGNEQGQNEDENEHENEQGDGAGLQRKHETSLEKVLRAFPHATKVADVKGRLPLHVAAMTPYFPDDVKCIEDGYRTNVQALLDAFPDAARQMDKRGRYPLQLAFVASKQWDPDLKALLGAAPAVASILDPITGLYPFMRAGIGNGASLDAIYALLQADPNAVSGGIGGY